MCDVPLWNMLGLGQTVPCVRCSFVEHVRTLPYVRCSVVEHGRQERNNNAGPGGDLGGGAGSCSF